MYLASRLFVFLFPSQFGLTGCHELGHVDGLGDYGSSNDIVVRFRTSIRERGR